jgi:hypothetical protein
MPGSPSWVHETSAAERFGESLLAFPFALLAGALLGALVGAIVIIPLDVLRWTWRKLRGIPGSQPTTQS